MKTLLLFVTLSVFLTLGLAQYNCPLEGINFVGSDLGIQRDVQSWQECGKKGTSTLISTFRGLLLYFTICKCIYFIFRPILPSPSRSGLSILELGHYRCRK